MPTVASVTGSPDAGLVQQITSPKTFDFSLTGDQTSQSGYIVLDPPTDQTGSSSSVVVRVVLLVGLDRELEQFDDDRLRPLVD